MRALTCAVALALLAGGAHAQILDDKALDEQRGGFVTAGGFTFGFGADVRTFVDGSLALESKVTWTGDGPDAGPNGPISTVTIPGIGGVSTIVHDFTAGQVRSLVSNTASDRLIVQDTNATITLPGFDAMQQGIAQQQLLSGLQNAVGLGLRDAASH